jgi:hypothetical protein
LSKPPGGSFWLIGVLSIRLFFIFLIAAIISR